MLKNKKILFSVIFCIILLVLTCFLLFKDESIFDVLEILQTINPIYILLGIILCFVYFIFQALYTKIALNSIEQKTTFKSSFIYSCIDYYFSAITPSSTGGQPFQTYYMAKDNIPVTKSSIVLLLNTITFKFVVIIFGILGIIINPKLIFGNSTAFSLCFIFGIVINIIISIGCIMLMFSEKTIRKIAIWGINLLTKLHLKKNAQETIDKMDTYMEIFKRDVDYLKSHLKLFVIVTVLTFIQRLALFSIGYVVYLAFGLSGVDYISFVILQASLAIAIDSLPFPGGMGVTEAMMLNVYLPIYGEHLLTTSILVTRIFSYYFCLLLSGIISLVNHIRLTIIKGKQCNNIDANENI